MDIGYIRTHFPTFKKITFLWEPSKGVARTNIRTREVIINTAKWYSIPFEHRFFILAHEEGHNIMHTKDELEADRYAYEKYEKYNFSNTEAVRALQLHLDSFNPVHEARIWQQYQRVLQNNYEEYGIQKAYRPHYQTIQQTKQLLKNKIIQ